MSKPSVFISYSRGDAKLAGQVEKALVRLGFETFNPSREQQPGEVWRKSIKAAIRQSDALVLIASPTGLAASWAMYETGAAEALGKDVLVLLPERHSASELPDEIATHQVVAFDPKSPERAAHDIAAHLEAA